MASLIPWVLRGHQWTCYLGDMGKSWISGEIASLCIWELLLACLYFPFLGQFQMSFLLMAVGCSRSVHWEGIDKNATWDFHAKYQSSPLVSSSLIRPDKALEEQKSNAGSKSVWKEAKTGLVYISSKSCTPRNPGFLHGSGSWARGWALCTWLRLLGQHSVSYLSCTMLGNFLWD